MTKRSLAIGSLTAAFALTACSGSGTSPRSVPGQNLSTNVLQLAVGTANIYGDQEGGGLTGLNVVATYRQGKGSLTPGDSAVAVSTPTFSGPFLAPATAGVGGPGSPFADPTSTIQTGPGPADARNDQLTGTAQLGSNLSTFGTSGGVFAIGIDPYNFNSTSGTPYTYQPYKIPLFDPNFTATIAGDPADPNAFVAGGFQPAFPTSPATSSLTMGLDIFEGITPVTGTYSLNVSVPASSTFSQTTSATLNSTALLPAWTIKTPTIDANGDGGVTFPVTLPAGVTEAYVEIYDLGNGSQSNGNPVSCNGSTSGAPTGYTIFVSASGTATLPPTLGAGGAPSICTAADNSTNTGVPGTGGDQFVVSYIGFDYPLYEASPSNNKSPSPTIVGANGQADVTLSSATVYQQVYGDAKLKSSKFRRVAGRAHAMDRARH